MKTTLRSTNIVDGHVPPFCVANCSTRRLSSWPQRTGGEFGRGKMMTSRRFTASSESLEMSLDLVHGQQKLFLRWQTFRNGCNGGDPQLSNIKSIKVSSLTTYTDNSPSLDEVLEEVGRTDPRRNSPRMFRETVRRE